MRIGFNIKPLKTGHKVRGIGSYTQNLLEQLKKRKDIEIIEFEDIDNVEDVDLIHYPFFDLFQKTLQGRTHTSLIVTIHDVIPLKFPNHYPKGIRGAINLVFQKRALRQVSAVITDSWASKADISRYLQFPEGIIFPIYLGVTDDFRVVGDQNVLKQIVRKYTLPNEFVLFIGDVNWNKNLSGLTKACIEARVNLVLVGSGFEKKGNLAHKELQSYRAFLEKFAGHPLVTVVGFVGREDLPKVINLARIVALPSFAEGFGLPILEAQACGVPVITSNISSMPEVAGEGAILVDPNDPTKIQSAISSLLNDERLRKDLVNKGFQNVSKFSWEKCANNTVETYELVLQNYEERSS